MLYNLTIAKNAFTLFLCLTTNKSLELEVSSGKQCCDWNLFKFDIEFTSKTDHAGFRFNFQLFSLIEFVFSIQDNRHWDYDNNCWEKY
jgi:hypothetical protein